MIEVEAEIMAALAQEITAEIDREIIQNLRTKLMQPVRYPLQKACPRQTVSFYHHLPSVEIIHAK